MTSIRLAEVSKQFGRTVAVDSVSLEIESGEMFFLLGPSGCGKTTLLRILAGFTVQDSGRVHFGNQRIDSVSPQHRGCGMVFQNYALWPHMSVAENVSFGLDVRRIPAAERTGRVREALAMVHLEGLEARKPGELSGGQQQRVALARALVIRPRCVLLDEPLSNLDAKLRVEMRCEIRRLCKQLGLTAVYVTHDQKEALSMADRIALMRDGVVIQCDVPGALYRHPATRFAAEFLGETNFLPAEVVQVSDGQITLQTALGQFRKAMVAEQSAEVVAAQKTADKSPDDATDSMSQGRGPAEPSSPSPRRGTLIGGQTLVVEGGSVTCSLRPEALHLAEDGSSDALGRNQSMVRLQATVLESTYLGDSAQHLLGIEGSDLQLLALEPNPLGDRRSGNVTAWFSTDDLTLLAD